MSCHGWSGESALSMPAFGNAYTDGEIAAVANYVTARYGAQGSKLTANGKIVSKRDANRAVAIGMALHEETLYDHRFARVMNANIAEYHVPVNADIHDIKVIFVDEPDEMVNPLGIKGLGEIGIVGVAAAVANSVYHATGKHVRDLPITLDKVVQFN